MWVDRATSADRLRAILDETNQPRKPTLADYWAHLRQASWPNKARTLHYLCWTGHRRVCAVGPLLVGLAVTSYELLNYSPPAEAAVSGVLALIVTMVILAYLPAALLVGLGLLVVAGVRSLIVGTLPEAPQAAAAATSVGGVRVEIEPPASTEAAPRAPAQSTESKGALPPVSPPSGQAGTKPRGPSDTRTTPEHESEAERAARAIERLDVDKAFTDSGVLSQLASAVVGFSDVPLADPRQIDQAREWLAATEAAHLECMLLKKRLATGHRMQEDSVWNLTAAVSPRLLFEAGFFRPPSRSFDNAVRTTADAGAEGPVWRAGEYAASGPDGANNGSAMQPLYVGLGDDGALPWGAKRVNGVGSVAFISSKRCVAMLYEYIEQKGPGWKALREAWNRAKLAHQNSGIDWPDSPEDGRALARATDHIKLEQPLAGDIVALSRLYQRAKVATEKARPLIAAVAELRGFFVARVREEAYVKLARWLPERTADPAALLKVTRSGIQSLRSASMALAPHEDDLLEVYDNYSKGQDWVRRTSAARAWIRCELPGCGDRVAALAGMPGLSDAALAELRVLAWQVAQLQPLAKEMETAASFARRARRRR